LSATATFHWHAWGKRASRARPDYIHRETRQAASCNTISAHLLCAHFVQRVVISCRVRSFRVGCGHFVLGALSSCCAGAWSAAKPMPAANKKWLQLTYHKRQRVDLVLVLGLFLDLLEKPARQRTRPPRGKVNTTDIRRLSWSTVPFVRAKWHTESTAHMAVQNSGGHTTRRMRSCCTNQTPEGRLRSGGYASPQPVAEAFYCRSNWNLNNRHSTKNKPRLEQTTENNPTKRDQQTLWPRYCWSTLAFRGNVGHTHAKTQS
jgi:hypothetical protein